MEQISIDLLEEIRYLVNDNYIRNELMNADKEKWLKMTSALDTIEDSASAINFYLDGKYPSEYGGKYLFLYGLLQSLYNTQDCISTMRSIYEKKISFKDEDEDLYYVRNIRDDILHATNRNRPEVMYMYLIRPYLCKGSFSYYKFNKEAEYAEENKNVFLLIERNNRGVNKFLQEIKLHLSNKLKEYKQKHNTNKLSEIFHNTNYFFEKILENPTLFDAAYKSTKEQLEKYKCELSRRRIDWQKIDAEKYTIDMAEKIYRIIDNNYLNDIKLPEIHNDVNNFLLLQLKDCFKQIRDSASDWDNYFEEVECEISNNHIGKYNSKGESYDACTNSGGGKYIE